MKFYVGEENGSGCQYRTKEAFLADLADRIDDAEKKGQQYFSVTVEHEE